VLCCHLLSINGFGRPESALDMPYFRYYRTLQLQGLLLQDFYQHLASSFFFLDFMFFRRSAGNYLGWKLCDILLLNGFVLCHYKTINRFYCFQCLAFFYSIYAAPRLLLRLWFFSAHFQIVCILIGLSASSLGMDSSW
jgi:hypothetical protein